jgi:LMBR1 domain-containing protein 1
LVNGSLPNPVDMVLVYSQAVFPLDYIIYCGMILFFILCSISGLRSLGITFFCLSVYKIRPGNTKPQALILMCFSMIFIVLAMNVVMFSVVPDYTTYGSQSYVANETHANVTHRVTKRCDDVEKR